MIDFSLFNLVMEERISSLPSGSSIEVLSSRMRTEREKSLMTKQKAVHYVSQMLTQISTRLILPNSLTSVQEIS